MPIRKDKEGFWHVEVCVDRQRIHRRLPRCSTKKDATQAEIDAQQSLAGSRFRTDPSLDEIMALYMAHAESLRSADTARFHAMRLEPWIEGSKASETARIVAQALPEMLKQYAPATVNRSLGTLKKALSLAWEQGVIPENYGAKIKRLKENNERKTVLSIAEIERLAACASENVRAAIWIAIYTGMRRGEIVKINELEVGEHEIVIPAGNTKTLKYRTVPIIDPVRPWLAYLPLPIGAEGIKSGFQRARIKAGLPHANFHDLRRSCGTLMVRAGVHLHVVSQLLGHSSVTVTEKVYAHLKTEQIREGLAKAFGG